MLAIGLSDSSLRLLSSFSGKTVHILPNSQDNSEPTSLSHLFWKSHFTSPSGTSNLLNVANEASQGKFVLEDLLSVTSQAQDLAKFAQADLPRALSAINIESSLLKLSTLPATGGDDDVFSSRSSLDAIFHNKQHVPTSSLPNDKVDILSTWSDNGLLHLRIYDCFEIGNVSILPTLEAQSSQGQDAPKDAVAVGQATHPLSPTCLLALRAPDAGLAEKARSFLVPITLQFLPNTVPHLSLVAQKCTQLTNIRRYLQQVRRQIELEWRTAQNLPSRFIRNVEGDLAGQEGANAMDFKTAVCHAVMTGDCPTVMREWLVDQVGDHGVKRWEKVVITGYETLRRLVQECLLPAIERAEVIVSRLFGLASYPPAAQALGLDVQRIEQVRDMLDCLTLLGEKLLLRVGKEFHAFEKFIRWLKLEIEIQSAEEGSQSWEELCEGREAIDVVGVLDFVSGTKGERNISDFIDEQKKPEGPSGWFPADLGTAFFGMYKEMTREGAVSKDMPKLHDLLSHLTTLCDQVFGHIGETLRKNVLIGRPSEITDLLKGTEIIDLRLVAEGSERFSAFIASARLDPTSDGEIDRAEIRIIQADLHAQEDIVLESRIQINFPQISDVAFVDDDALFILSSTAESSRILEIRFRELDPQPSLRHDFGRLEPHRRPKKMDVNGRKGRRAVVVLDRDRMRYSVFDINNEPSVEPEEAEAGEREETQLNGDMETAE